MSLAAFELRQCFESLAAVVVVGAEHRKSHEYLVGVQSRVAASQIARLRVLDRFDHVLRYELDLMVDAGKMFEGVEQQGGARAGEIG